MPATPPRLEDFGLDPATVRYYMAREWSWVARLRQAHTRTLAGLWAVLAGGLYAGLVWRALGPTAAPDPAQRLALIGWGCGLIFPLVAALLGFLAASSLLLGLSLAKPLLDALQLRVIARGKAFRQASDRYQAYLDACQAAGVTPL